MVDLGETVVQDKLVLDIASEAQSLNIRKSLWDRTGLLRCDVDRRCDQQIEALQFLKGEQRGNIDFDQIFSVDNIMGFRFAVGLANDGQIRQSFRAAELRDVADKIIAVRGGELATREDTEDTKGAREAAEDHSGILDLADVVHIQLRQFGETSSLRNSGTEVRLVWERKSLRLGANGQVGEARER